ncbi:MULTISPECIES: hypothetical protein [unclassified Roseofilum]|nr:MULTISPECIES: hypothetical protein [unclassified Roseofilum]
MADNPEYENLGAALSLVEQDQFRGVVFLRLYPFSRMGGIN